MEHFYKMSLCLYVCMVLFGKTGRRCFDSERCLQFKVSKNPKRSKERQRQDTLGVLRTVKANEDSANSINTV